MESLIETLNSFDTSLLKGSKNALQKRMSYYDNNFLQFNKDFYTIKINSDEKIQALVAKILKNLAIPEPQWSRYLGVPMTVNELLVELRDHKVSENRKIDEFIGLINKQIRMRWKMVIYGSFIIFAAAEASSPFLAANGGLTALQGLIAAAAFVPFMGMLYTTFSAFYSIYQNTMDKKIPFIHRMQRNFFLLAQTAIKLAGYSILLAAATTSTPVVAALFVAAAAVVVVKEVTSLIRMSFKERHHPVTPDGALLQERQVQARHAVDYIKRRNDGLIKTTTALIGVGIVAVSFFVPGGIFITIGAVVAITALYFVEQAVLNRNKAVMDKRLCDQFKKIEKDYNIEKLKTLQQADTLTHQVALDRTVKTSVVEQTAQINDRLSHPSLSGFFSVNSKSASLKKGWLQTESDAILATEQIDGHHQPNAND